MSAFGPGGGAPAHKGKLHTKTPVKRVGQAKPCDCLSIRMKMDDSAAVNMSDRKLGKGIRG
jgi:hypothetical protein